MGRALTLNLVVLNGDAGSADVQIRKGGAELRWVARKAK